MKIQGSEPERCGTETGMKPERLHTPAESRYADIIDLPRHRSPNRRPMPTSDRAAQFASFAALAGHEEAVAETARLTETRPVLTEDKKQMLDETLRMLCAEADAPPTVRITYFRQDEKKAGGRCITTTGQIREADPLSATVILSDKRCIPVEDILEIEYL